MTNIKKGSIMFDMTNIKPEVQIVKTFGWNEPSYYEIKVWLHGGSPVSLGKVTKEELLNQYTNEQRLGKLKELCVIANKDFEELKNNIEDPNRTEEDVTGWQLHWSIKLHQEAVAKIVTDKLQVALTSSEALVANLIGSKES
jgi:hypothetical protein